MKRSSILIFSTLLAPMSLLAGLPYSINAKIQGLPQGATVRLAEILHVPTPDVVSATVGPDGTFSVSGEVEQPTAVRMYLEGAIGFQLLMLGDGAISISGDANPQPRQEGGKPCYDFSELSITGSPLTAHYLDLYEVHRRADKMHEDYMNKFAPEVEMKMQGKKADEIPNYEAMAKAEKEFFDTMVAMYTKTMDDNKDTFWGPLMVFTLMNYTTPEVRTYWESMSQEAKDSYYGKKLKEDLWPVENLGNLSEVVFTAPDGTTKTYRDLVGTKKCVILDFWASWCGPCRREIPNIKGIYDQWKDMGFDVVSVSIDEDPDAWQEAVNKEELKWHNYRDHNGPLQTMFKVKSVPTILVMDGKGDVLASGLRGQELADKVAEIMKN